MAIKYDLILCFFLGYHRLNPNKCVFGVTSEKFLSFMVHNRGIETNPEKFQALMDMKSPVKVKYAKYLTRCVTTLNLFVAQATDQCFPFLKALKKNVVILFGQMITTIPSHS